MPKIIWKPVPGYPAFEVSDHGHIRDAATKHLHKVHKANGYTLTGLGKRGSTTAVHRLVLAAFVGPAPTGMECRHLNGNKGDNRLKNLCWGSRRENTLDAARHGTSCIRFAEGGQYA